MEKKGPLYITAILSVLLITMLSGTGSVFAGSVRVAVLPFQINAQTHLDFLKTGIQDMLASRLAWKDQVEVIDKTAVNSTVKTLGQFKEESLALLAGGQLKADYIISGSVTIIGQGASIDAKIMDITGKIPPVTFFGQTTTLGGVIPEINRFATEINERVFNRHMGPAQAPAVAASQPFVPRETVNPLLTAVEGTAGVNPNFKTANSGNLNTGFWKSRPLPFRILGMDLGDVNNDGILDTVILTDDLIIIYQMANNRLVKAAEIPVSKLSHHLGLDIGDINGNGTPEIFVSSLSPEQNRATASVLEYNGKGYDTIVKNAPWYYRISRTMSGETLLLGQKQRERDANIHTSPVYKMQWQGNDYVPGGMILKGKTTNVMGLAVDDIRGDGTSEMATYDTSEHLTLFGETQEMLWRDSEPSGGTTTSFTLPKENADDGQQLQFFPLRVRIHDIDKNGVPEIITAANHDVALTFLSNIRSFDRGTLESRSWKEMGMILNWKSNALPGRISDFVIGDFDNDGFDELIAATITKEGTTVMSQVSSTLVAYELLKTNNR